MSSKLTLFLEKDRQKPIWTMLDDVLVLFDTGADTPVWCGSEERLLNFFPDADKTKYKFQLSGFGKGTELVDVYRIPNFKIGSDGAWIEYKNVHVAVSYRPSMGVDFVLPATFFKGMRFVVDRLSNPNQPFLEIESPKECISMFIKRKTYKNSELLLHIYADGDNSLIEFE